MRAVAALLAIAAAVALAVPGAAAAAQPRTSLSDIEDEVMCVVCNVTLNVAESPQADRERALIKQLIAQGKTKKQVKAALVAQYGDAVLATPHGSGLDWAAWAIPAAAIAAVLAALAFFVPRWRRRDTPPQAAAPAGPALDAADARRLDEDLARYEP
jgi:cytochrome c-type biogenesis protein CcmH/NrfF